MTNLYPTHATKASAFLFSSFIYSVTLSAQCPANSIPASANGSYNSGQVVCVSSTFSGNITLASGSQLFIAPGGKFTGGINAGSNVEILVQTNGTFAPANYFNGFGGKITNNGKITLNYPFSSLTNLTNNAELTINSNFNAQVNLLNTACGKITYPNGALWNSTNTIITNNGLITIASGKLELAQNNKLLNYGKIYVNGTSSFSGYVSNDGYIVVNGGVTLNGDSLINNYVLAFDGSTGISKNVLNTGLFWIKGGATFNNQGAFTQKGTSAFLRVDGKLSIDGRKLTGTGLAYHAGKLDISNNGIFGISETTVPKDTNNFTPTLASPAAPCGTVGNLLPIILKNFVARSNGNTVEINWSTVSELNGKSMTVQHSTNGIQFNEVYTVTSAAGSTTIQNYSYTDKRAASGSNYYRLKLVSFDADDVYSNVVAVNLSATADRKISIYPDPFTDHFTIKNTAATFAGNIILKLYNDKGAVVMSQTENNLSGIHIILPSSLAKGIYVLEINSNSGKSLYRLMKL